MNAVGRASLKRMTVLAPWKILLLLTGAYLALTVFYFQANYMNHLGGRIAGVDSVYYYAYLRSIVFDGDLDFANELKRLTPPGYQPGERTATGLTPNVFSVGPAILWSPFFLAAHAIVRSRAGPDSKKRTDGYEYIYQSFVYIGNSLYGLFAVWLIALLLLRLGFHSLTALLGALAVLGASQLTYYLWSMTALSHNVSVFAVTLFLLCWLRSGSSPVTALAAALMLLTRTQNAVFLLLPVLSECTALFNTPSESRLPVFVLLRRYAVFAGVLLLGFLPQMIAWKILYGSFLTLPQGGGFLHLSQPALFQTMFSLRNGLFSSHPILLVGLCGLLFFKAPASGRFPRPALLVIFGAVLYLNASVGDWWAGWSFGNRRFISLLPIFTIGLCTLIELLATARSGRIVVLILTLFFSAWNQIHLYQYQRGLIPRGGRATFSEFFTDKFRVRSVRQARHLLYHGMLRFGKQGSAQDLHQHVSEAVRLHKSHRFVYVPIAYLCARGFSGYDCLPALERWRSEDPGSVPAILVRLEYNRRQGKPIDSALAAQLPRNWSKHALLALLAGDRSILEVDFVRKLLRKELRRTADRLDAL